MKSFQDLDVKGAPVGLLIVHECMRWKTRLLFSVVPLLYLASLGCVPGLANHAHKQNISSISSTQFVVVSPSLTLYLSAEGEITGAVVGPRKEKWDLFGRTILAGCHVHGPVIVKRLVRGGYSFERTWLNSRHDSCRVTDRFTPTATSVRWQITLVSTNKPWSTAVETRLDYPASPATRFWTAWSDPDHSNSTWHDPLVLRPFSTTVWSYSNLSKSTPVRGDFISLPLVTIAEPHENTGLSLVLSPRDTILNMWLSTTKAGRIDFFRTRHRLGGGRPVHFTMDLTSHEAGWRGGLRWMVNRYPKFFNPPNPLADSMAGCGAYSGDEDTVNVTLLKRMGFRVLWQLSDDFPYPGMFIPPVTSAGERWTRSCAEPAPPDKPRWMTTARLNAFARYLKINGFYFLAYFNVAEFGKEMTNAPIDMAQARRSEVWKNPEAFLRSHFPRAVMYPDRSVYEGGRVLDVGNQNYRRFILKQARRIIHWLPDAAGICIDRLDWLEKYNPYADDGVSWVLGHPARSMIISWKELMERLGPLMHRANKVIFVNPLDSRLDLLRHVDGIYGEFGQTGAWLNATALMGVRKTVIGWTYEKTLRQAGSNSYFQRLLLLGVYPTAPYPWNNHCIQPSAWADQQYVAYAPLFKAMRGKRWVLAPNCVRTSTAGVKVNLFAVTNGYALPVTFWDSLRVAKVEIQNLPDIMKLRCAELLPGHSGAVPLSSTVEGRVLKLTVPLKRGCAMVLLTPTP